MVEMSRSVRLKNRYFTRISEAETNRSSDRMTIPSVR